MSDTSDQTTKQNDKTRLIVGEVGIDTETGIVGKGHSYDNGKTFTVDDTIYGRIYHADDNDKIWKGIQDQVAKVVVPAKSAADSAVSAADAAVASAQVTSDAMSAVASATAEAKQGANEAMSRSKSAWDVATNATNAASSAQSDAKQATSSVAVLSTSVDTLKGTVSQNTATLKTQADNIQSKVSASDVTGMLTGYATQSYTQSLVTQTADEWNLNLTNLKDDTQTSVTNLSATVDGIKGTVYTKDEVNAAIAASESKFASVIDTGWVPISLLNGAKKSGVTNQVRKIGSQVYIEFAAENLWSAKNELIAVLPVGFRPDQTIWRKGRSNAGTDEVEYSIGTDGGIVIGLKSGKNTSSDYLWISEPFLAAD